MKIISGLALVFSAASAQATPTHIIVLAPSADASTVEAIEGQARALSVETGSGEVRRHRDTSRITADMSEAAAAKIRALDGVEGVWTDVAFTPMAPSHPASASSQSRIVHLNADLPISTVQQLVRQIREVSNGNGSGYCEYFFDQGLLRANLSEDGVTAVRALDGVRDVEVDGVPAPSAPPIADAP